MTRQMSYAQHMPKPQEVAKSLLRKVFHDSWIPELKLQKVGFCGQCVESDAVPT